MTAKAKCAAAMQRFRRQMQNTMPPVARHIPDEANDVDVIDKNISRHIESIFMEQSLAESLKKEMTLAAQREQKQDEENMRDFVVQGKVVPKKPVDNESLALPKRLAALDALMIERYGKLEASFMQLTHEISSTTDLDLSLLVKHICLLLASSESNKQL